MSDAEFQHRGQRQEKEEEEEGRRDRWSDGGGGVVGEGFSLADFRKVFPQTFPASIHIAYHLLRILQEEEERRGHGLHEILIGPASAQDGQKEKRRERKGGDGGEGVFLPLPAFIMHPPLL